MREKIIKKASSTVVAFIGILVIVLILSAKKSPALKRETAAKAYSILSLGDSYTIGEKVPTHDNFPNQAVQQLKEKGYNFQQPVIIAKTGWTTDELQSAINKARLKNKYDFVTLLIGVNNQYRGRKVVEYIPQFEELLKRAIKFTGNDSSSVIVLSIPDWGVTPFAEGRNRENISKEIDEFNSANRLLAQQFKVHYIDITPGSRKAGTDSTLLTDDGLHPSAKEYNNWANQIVAVIQKAF